MGVLGKTIPPGSAGKPTRTGAHRAGTGLGADESTAPINTRILMLIGKNIHGRDGSSLICQHQWPQKVSGSVSWLPSAEQPLSLPGQWSPSAFPRALPLCQAGVQGCTSKLGESRPSSHSGASHSPWGFPTSHLLGGRVSLAPGTPSHSQRGATWVLLFIHLSCMWK